MIDAEELVSVLMDLVDEDLARGEDGIGGPEFAGAVVLSFKRVGEPPGKAGFVLRLHDGSELRVTVDPTG